MVATQSLRDWNLTATGSAHFLPRNLLLIAAEDFSAFVLHISRSASCCVEQAASKKS